MQRVRLALCACIFLLGSHYVMAQSSARQMAPAYPAKVLRIIVPWVGGGGTDIIARIIATRLSDNVAQPVVVENRPGANGIIGASLAARAAPDGYTMVLHAVDHIMNAALRHDLPYDTIKDFAAVAELGTQPLVLVVNPSMNARSVKELVALAKSSPKSLSYGSWGEGSLGHLTGVLMTSTASIQMLHVPYQSGPQALNDIMGGRLDLLFNTMPPTVPLIKAGRLRALAVTTSARAPSLPEVPTMIEAGYRSFEVDSWRGMYVPAGTPQTIVKRLNAELLRVLGENDVKEKLLGVGFDVKTSTPEELDKLSRSELERWTRLVRQAGININAERPQ